MTFMATPSQVLFVSHRRSVRAFTLVEMFIVGALIALFAGIAVINIQQQFNSNKRKAMIGEGRQLGTALGFAKLDLGLYPRVCFLQYSDRQMQFEARDRGLTPGYFYQILDYTGIGTVPNAAALRASWRGPYFSASQSRAGVQQGRGGFSSMTLPELGANSKPFRWPCDGYANPWVLYLVSIDLNTNQPYFINGNPPNAANAQSPTVNADYLTAVVSYGFNHIPGGGPQVDPATALAALDLRLYKATGADPRDFRGQDYTMLTFTEYTSQRAAAISNRFGTAGLAPNEQDVPTGILDEGSDDIVYEF